MGLLLRWVVEQKLPVFSLLKSGHCLDLNLNIDVNLVVHFVEIEDRLAFTSLVLGVLLLPFQFAFVVLLGYLRYTLVCVLVKGGSHSLFEEVAGHLVQECVGPPELTNAGEVYFYGR